MKQGQHRHSNNRQQQRGRGGGGGGGGGGGNRPGGRMGGGGGNPVNRVYESNGPDLKVRGTAQTIAEKYQQLARDAHTTGDPVMAESYYQHAEHYLRILAAAQVFNQQNAPQQTTRRDEYDDEIDTTETGDAPSYVPPQGSDSDDETNPNLPSEMEGQPMFTPPPPREPREPREHRDQRESRGEHREPRENREPRPDQPRDFRADRPRRFDERRPPRESRGQDDQPVVGDEGWTGPQPSFLKRPVPLAPLAPLTPITAAPAAAAIPATEPAQTDTANPPPRARRAYTRKVVEAAEETPEPAASPTEE